MTTKTAQRHAFGRPCPTPLTPTRKFATMAAGMMISALVLVSPVASTAGALWTGGAVFQN